MFIRCKWKMREKKYFAVIIIVCNKQCSNQSKYRIRKMHVAHICHSLTFAKVRSENHKENELKMKLCTTNPSTYDFCMPSIKAQFHENCAINCISLPTIAWSDTGSRLRQWHTSQMQWKKRFEPKTSLCLDWVETETCIDWESAVYAKIASSPR